LQLSCIEQHRSITKRICLILQSGTHDQQTITSPIACTRPNAEVAPSCPSTTVLEVGSLHHAVQSEIKDVLELVTPHLEPANASTGASTLLRMCFGGSYRHLNQDHTHSYSDIIELLQARPFSELEPPIVPSWLCSRDTEISF
jgi:hypothetical protein